MNNLPKNVPRCIQGDRDTPAYSSQNTIRARECRAERECVATVSRYTLRQPICTVSPLPVESSPQGDSIRYRAKGLEMVLAGSSKAAMSVLFKNEVEDLASTLPRDML